MIALLILLIAILAVMVAPRYNKFMSERRWYHLLIAMGVVILLPLALILVLMVLHPGPVATDVRQPDASTPEWKTPIQETKAWPTPGSIPVRRAIAVTAPTPDPWDNPEYKNLLKPQTKEQKEQEKKDAKNWRPAGAAGEPPARSAWDGITGGSETKNAVQAVVSDPDSVKLESSTSPYIDRRPDGECWTFKVMFRHRNGFGGYVKSVATVYWRNGKVIDCVIDF